MSPIPRRWGRYPRRQDSLREPSDTSRTTRQQPGEEPDCRGGEVDSRQPGEPPGHVEHRADGNPVPRMAPQPLDTVAAERARGRCRNGKPQPPH